MQISAGNSDADQVWTPAMLGQIFTEMRDTVDSNPEGLHDYIDALERVLLPRFAAPYLPLPVANLGGRGALAPWQLKRALAHAEAHLSDAVEVGDLSTRVGLSSGHFSRAFKATTGETPHGYIVRLRLRRAQERMLASKEPLSEIASACGFTDQAHMTRLFRRHVGETPFLWRRRYLAT